LFHRLPMVLWIFFRPLKKLTLGIELLKIINLSSRLTLLGKCLSKIFQESISQTSPSVPQKVLQKFQNRGPFHAQQILVLASDQKVGSSSPIGCTFVIPWLTMSYGLFTFIKIALSEDFQDKFL
jgi:hypothetical protein